MEEQESIDTFAALAQPTRLAAFRELVRSEPGGLAAGALAQKLKIPQNTLSSHLALLANAGWVTGKRSSRSIIYRANLTRVGEVIAFLLNDCCEGKCGRAADPSRRPVR